MAGAANAGRKAAHPSLKLINGQGNGKDSGGREIPENVPFTRSAPSKPDTLSDDASWLWDQVVEQMQAIGLLKPLDAAALEMACETFARWREAVAVRAEQGLSSTNSQGVVTGYWIGIEERASKDFRAWCAEFGFTPASEKNLVSGDGKNDGGDDNPF